MPGRGLVGHPVDVASGEQFTAAHDIEIDGIIPLIFRRAYNTAFLDRPPSILGLGWVHHFEATLVEDLCGYEFEGHNGNRIQFDINDKEFSKTGSILNAGESMELRREGNKIAIYHWHGLEEPVQKYIFDPADGERMRLRSRELPSGHKLVLHYDSQGRVSSVTQSAEGRCLFFNYDQKTGLLNELWVGISRPVQVPKQLVAKYVYDDHQRLIAVYDAAGHAQGYQYDEAGRLIYECDRRGGAFRMKYDHRGRCTETKGDGDQDSRELVYVDATSTRVKDSQGNWTLYQFNESGQVEKKVMPNGATYVTEYDKEARICAEIGPLGSTTSFEFDERGNLAKKTFPNGAVQQFEYDEFHQPTKIIDPDGGGWLMRYERGALVERTDPVGRKTKYLRDFCNDLIGAVSPSGNQIRISVDNAYTKETITDSCGLVVERKLDLFLNPIEISDAAGTDLFTYDVLGRIVETTKADQSRRRFAYDPEGALLKFWDARNAAREAHYSAYGKCLQQVDPLGQTHQYDWDTEGRLIAIRNPKNETAKLEYDPVGNLIKIEHFDDSVELFEYDLEQRVIKRTKPDGTVLEFLNDSAGNVIQISSNGKELRRTKYDLCGSPVETKTPDSTVGIEYDLGGRIKAEIQNGRRVDYTYDQQGSLTQREFAGSKAGALEFTHDKRGRLLSFSARERNKQLFKYDEADRICERTFDNAREKLEYDLVGQLSKQEIRSLHYPIYYRTYKHDSEGALIESVDILRGRRRTYQYDAVEQLVRSTAAYIEEQQKKGFLNQEHQYQYDANGNLTARDKQLLSYLSGDRLASIGFWEFQRDANGCLVSTNGGNGWSNKWTNYQWDELGQLKKVLHPNGAITSFGYDAFGRRVFKEHCGRRTNYFWSGDDLLAEETSEQLTEYAIFGAWPKAIWENGKVRHVVTSQNGTPQELIDEDGYIIWKGEFDDWGKLVWEKGETTCRLRLLGQIADLETGLHYNRFRYYLPEIGQFISPDPIGMAGGTNRFRYAPNAIGWVDVLGLVCKKGHKEVFRQLSLEDRIALDEGRDLTPKGTGGSIAVHVAGGDTQHISASLTEGATERFSSGNGLVAIDIDIATSNGAKYIDHGNVLQAVRRDGTTRDLKNAVRAKEVLFKGTIPRAAIRLIRG